MTSSSECRGSRVSRIARSLAAGSLLAASSWAVYAAIAWLRYGHQKKHIYPSNKDSLLDQFMPEYEVADRHQTRVAASPESTYAAAAALELERSRIVRGLFKARELILRSQPEHTVRPKTLITWAGALGWGVLAQVPGREMIFGAVTKPWEANVVFRALAPQDFLSFRAPGYAKIVWTLRVDAISAAECIASTETRVATTDAGSRRKFRRYWAFLSPGILLLRRVALTMVKQQAEARACQRNQSICSA